MLKPEDLARLEANAGRVIVAYSGGSDSHVLLQYLQANLDRPVEALHVNHGLSPNADQWQQHCEAVCDALNLPLTSYNVEVDRSGSLEANARAARYAVFELALKTGDALLMGHHRDDQIETIFLNLLSGRALLGVQGMPKERELGRGWLFRPLLDRTRDELRAYARSQALAWIEDESNLDTEHDRNYLRQRVLPLLHQRWPEFASTIVGQEQKSARYLEHLEQEANADFARLRIALDCIDYAGFVELPETRAVALLRCWLRNIGSDRNPGSETLRNAVQVLSSKTTESATFDLGGYQLQHFRSRLVLVYRSELRESDSVQLRGEQGRFGAGILSADIVKGRGISVPFRQLNFKSRQGGEKLLVNGHHRTLKNVFQASGYPPLVRDQIPLIFVDDELVGLAGIERWHIPMVVADPFRPPEDAEGCDINWVLERDNRYTD